MGAKIINKNLKSFQNRSIIPKKDTNITVYLHIKKEIKYQLENMEEASLEDATMCAPSPHFDGTRDIRTTKSQTTDSWCQKLGRSE